VGSRYLDMALLGRHSALHYVVAVLLILFSWFGVGGVLVLLVPIFWATATLGAAFELDASTLTPVGVDRFVNYVALNLSFIAFLVGILLAMTLIHRRSPRTLITPYGRIDWRRVGQGFGVWLVLSAIGSLVEALLFPGRYELSPDWSRLAFVAPLVLLLTPLQTSAEELFFRGYLLQWFGLRARNPAVLALTTAVIFTLPHLGNPEVGASNPILIVASYFATGILFALTTLVDNGLELALGAHASNNLFSALIANYAVSALETDSVFVIREIDAVFSDIQFLIMAGIFWLVVFKLLRRPAVA
jgi:membrane protease YdiL (CAAX protease family)